MRVSLSQLIARVLSSNLLIIDSSLYLGPISGALVTKGTRKGIRPATSIGFELSDAYFNDLEDRNAALILYLCLSLAMGPKELKVGGRLSSEKIRVKGRSRSQRYRAQNSW